MRVLFVVVVPFPFGDASSIRAFNLCKLLNLAGHNVHVISDYPSRTKVDTPLSFCTYEDASTRFKNGSVVSKCLRAVKEYLDENPTDVIVMNARYDRYNQLINVARRRRIKVVVENCEWYDSSSFKMGRFDPRFYQNERMIRFGFKEADGFISISELLNTHNRKWGATSVRIPTILDVRNAEWSEENNNERVTLVYAGSLGKSKELLQPLIRCIAKHTDLQKHIELHIYGPTIKEVIQNIGDSHLMDHVGRSVVIHGRVSQTLMPSIMRNADYVVFLRPCRLSSNAGFPTKMGESMSVGTPVITNITGDIPRYVRSKENGMLIPNSSDECVHEVLEQVILMSDSERRRMRKLARRTAESFFDYRSYIAEIEELFSSL